MSKTASCSHVQQLQLSIVAELSLHRWASTQRCQQQRRCLFTADKAGRFSRVKQTNHDKPLEELHAHTSDLCLPHATFQRFGPHCSLSAVYFCYLKKAAWLYLFDPRSAPNLSLKALSTRRQQQKTQEIIGMKKGFCEVFYIRPCDVERKVGLHVSFEHLWFCGSCIIYSINWQPGLCAVSGVSERLGEAWIYASLFLGVSFFSGLPLLSPSCALMALPCHRD